MQFSIERDRFISDIQHVVKAVSARTTIPILTGIKIMTTNEGITLTGSDSDISIETFIPKVEKDREVITVKETGSIVLQAHLFADIIKKLPGEEVEIVVEDQFKTVITSGSSVFNLNGLNPDEYPRLPQLEENLLFQIPQRILKSVINETVFAVSTQETRPVLTGVNFELENSKLTCTATDSHRLAMKKVSIESNDDTLSFSNVVVPGKSLNELNRILDDSDDLVHIVVTDTQILFKMENMLFFSRLLEGKYPVTENMIPTESKITITLNNRSFLHTLERALLLSAKAKNNVVHLKTLQSNEIEITSVSPEIGTVTEHIDAIDMKGEEMQISFNGKNIIDALKVIDYEEITVMFTGAMSPFVIRPVENDGDLHLFSPVRTY